MLMDIIRKIPAAKASCLQAGRGENAFAPDIPGDNWRRRFKIFQVCGKGAAGTFQDGILKKRATRFPDLRGPVGKGGLTGGAAGFQPQQQVLAQKDPGRTFQKFQQFSEAPAKTRGQRAGCSELSALVAMGVFHYLTVKFVGFFRKKRAFRPLSLAILKRDLQ